MQLPNNNSWKRYNFLGKKTKKSFQKYIFNALHNQNRPNLAINHDQMEYDEHFVVVREETLCVLMGEESKPFIAWSNWNPWPLVVIALDSDKFVILSSWHWMSSRNTKTKDMIQNAKYWQLLKKKTQLIKMFYFRSGLEWSGNMEISSLMTAT